MTKYLDEEIETPPFAARVQSYFDEGVSHSSAEDIRVSPASVDGPVVYPDGGYCLVPRVPRWEVAGVLDYLLPRRPPSRGLHEGLEGNRMCLNKLVLRGRLQARK